MAATRFLHRPTPLALHLDQTGSLIERWDLFDAEPMIDLTVEETVSGIANEVVAAELPLAPSGPEQRAWERVSRSEARRLMLYALRFSMAYGGAPRANTEAFHAVDVFLTAFSADAQFLTPVAQLARLLDEDGCTPSGGFGYGMSFFLTTATFEAGIVVVDWALVGLFVATDED